MLLTTLHLGKVTNINDTCAVHANNAADTVGLSCAFTLCHSCTAGVGGVSILASGREFKAVNRAGSAMIMCSVHLDC
jgi:hypothetical protein